MSQQGTVRSYADAPTRTIADSFEETAADVVAVIRALGHDRVDMFGLAVGGMVAQAVAARAPRLIDRLILASAGPAGGPGLAAMTGTALTTGLRAALTLNDHGAVFQYNREFVDAARDFLRR